MKFSTNWGGIQSCDPKEALESKNEIDMAIAEQLGLFSEVSQVKTRNYHKKKSEWGKLSKSARKENFVEISPLKSRSTLFSGGFGGGQSIHYFSSSSDLKSSDEQKVVDTYSPRYLNDVLENYFVSFEREKTDFTRRVPFKTVTKESKNFMGGVLGYTMLGEGWIVLRDDLQGARKHMVDVHESIHTNNEYETRVITNWMLSKQKPLSQQY